jgi:hypothetical protein
MRAMPERNEVESPFENAGRLYISIRSSLFALETIWETDVNRRVSATDSAKHYTERAYWKGLDPSNGLYGPYSEAECL